MDKQCLYAYFAGSIDSDGFISIQRSIKKISKLKTEKIYYTAKIGFTGTANPIVQELFHQEFAGSIYKHQPKNSDHKLCYIWQATDKKAKQAIEAIYPYLLVKKEQARLVLEFINLCDRQWEIIKTTQIPPYQVTPEMESERRYYWEEVTKLNQPRNRRIHHLETV